MFEFRLLLVRVQDRLVLRFSYLLKSVFVGLAVLVALAMGVSGSASLLGEILVALALLGALFEERWTWDPQARTLTHRSGVVFWVRQTVYPADTIAGFEVRRVTRGQGLFAKKTVGLALETRDAGVVTVESHRERKDDDLPEFARLVAEAIGVPVKDEV